MNGGTDDGKGVGEQKVDVEEVKLDPSLPPNVINEAIHEQGRISTIGLVAGALFVLAGIVLMVLGFTGSVDINVRIGDMSGHLVTGSLGVLVALIGVVFIVVTNYSVDVTRRNGDA